MNELVEQRVRHGAGRRLLVQSRGAGGHKDQGVDRRGEAVRLARILTVAPLGVAADRVEDHAAHHPVAPGDRVRQAGQRHQRVHKPRVALAPQPRLHAAHRGAYHQTQVVYAEPLRQQPMLRAHHIVVGVARKARTQAVAGLARTAVPDAIGKDEEVARRVEQLPRAEQDARELVAQKGLPSPTRAMQEQHRVPRDPRRVAGQCAERSVVQPQLRQPLAALEGEVVDQEVALHRRW